MKRRRFHKGNFLNTESTEIDLPAWRLYVIFFFFLLCTFLIGGRLIHLHVRDVDFLRAQGDARTLRIVDIPSYRGMVTDRRSTPLAISTPVHAVWINPQHFKPSDKQVSQLAKLLELPEKTIKQKTTQNAKRVFVYLKRGIPPDVAEKIELLNIPGLSLKREFRRYYPSGRQSAQLVGFTDIDDKGQSGLELAFEESLKPIIGKKRVLEDRSGRWVQDVDYLRTAQSGKDIALSIDLRIQGIAYRELEKALKEFNAKSATLCMLDVQTGEVLAMVTAPSFNPNNRELCQGSTIRNRALTDLFEPGSTVKAFSVASALASRRFTTDTIIDTHPGTMYVNNHVVRDLHNYGMLNFQEILKKSSNIGITKMTLALPPEQLISTFQNLGLGNSIKTPFPGERQGTLPTEVKNDFALATLAFGYSLAVTPLQIVHAYSVLANHGKMRPISLLKVSDPEQKGLKQVLPADVADTTLQLLIRPVIPGFKTAGKTGTTRVVGPNGYDPHRHNALFVGITPVDKPRFATIVLVEEPDGKLYYGAEVAVPIYKNVVSKALHILNIAQDDPQKVAS